MSREATAVPTPTQPPTLEQSLQAFAEGLPEDARPDTLQQLFYGFYARVAIVDRSTHELAQWATNGITAIADVPAPLTEALRDNSLHVGRELFATRIQAMTAMGLVSSQLAALRPTLASDHAFALKRAVAFDQQLGEIRSYDLTAPGEHPDLPYDPFSYDPNAESDAAGDDPSSAG